MRIFRSMLVSLLVTIVSLSCTADPVAVRDPWPVASLAVEPASAAIPVGTFIQLTATPLDPRGATFVGLPTSWTTSDGSTATVTNGIVHGMAAGQVEIIATVEGKSDTAVITITSPPEAPPPSPRFVCSISPIGNQDAIAQAIASCPAGSTVTFPLNASYHITDKIVVAGRSDLVIDGNGSTFTKTSPYAEGVWKPQWVISHCTDFVMRNMTIVGSFPTQPRRGAPGNQFEPGINIAGCTNVSLQDLTVRNVYGDCVLVLDQALAQHLSYNVRIQRLTCRGAARHAVVPEGVVGFWLEDSDLSDLHYSGIDAEIDIAGQPIQDLHFLNNTITEYFISGFGVPVKGTAPGQVANIEIRGNTIGPSDTCWPALQVVYPPNNVGNEAIRLDGIVIEDNTLRSLHHAVELADVNSGSVRNNVIEAVGAEICGPGRQAVKLLNSPNVVVGGNTLIGY